METQLETENQNEVDTEKLSIDELKALASKQPEAKTQAQTPTETNTTDDTDDTDPDTGVTIYRRDIDLKDGSGVQRFEAESMEELVDKLVTAQENATRKIRELSKTVRPKPAEVPAKKPLTPEEEFLLGQEFTSKPSAAFAKLFEQTVGMPIGSFQTKVEKIAAFEKAQAFTEAAQDFVTRTPEYLANETNGKKIVKYLETYRLDSTVENMTKAFQDLNTSGLLESKSDATGADGTDGTANDTVTSRIEKPAVEQSPAVTTQPKKAASGLSSRGRSVVPVTRPSGPTEQECYDMSLDKLRELAQASSRR